MNRLFYFIAAIAATLLLNGCLGGAFNLGSSAAPPANIKVIPGDSQVTLTWDTASGVEYWVFAAPGTSVTTSNWDVAGGSAFPKATSPHVVVGLTNGTAYAFTINSRIDGGPGGTGSPSVSVTPRLAGAEWANGNALTTNNLNGVAFGSGSSNGVTQGTFVAVGAHGALYSSPDFNAWTTPTWTALTNPGSADLYAATYQGSLYVAVGAGGTILTSGNTLTWTQQTSNTTMNLYGTGINGAGGVVAVGQAGAIVASANGTSWTALTPPAAANGNDLYGVAFGNNTWVVVGNGGTLLTSANGVTWTAPTSLAPTINLKSVTYGVNVDPATKTITGYLFVAIGDNGVLVTSADGVTWTQSTIGATNNLAAVTFGREFIAVGDSGSIFTSSNGTVWTAQASNTTSNLKAIGHSTANYSAVGATGTNLSAI